MPPYNKILGEQVTRLNDILNEFSFFFEDGMTTEDYIYGQFNEDTVNEYGTGEKDERGYYSNMTLTDATETLQLSYPLSAHIASALKS